MRSISPPAPRNANQALIGQARLVEREGKTESGRLASMESARGTWKSCKREPRPIGMHHLHARRLEPDIPGRSLCRTQSARDTRGENRVGRRRRATSWQRARRVRGNSTHCQSPPAGSRIGSVVHSGSFGVAHLGGKRELRPHVPQPKPNAGELALDRPAKEQVVESDRLGNETATPPAAGSIRGFDLAQGELVRQSFCIRGPYPRRKRQSRRRVPRLLRSRRLGAQRPGSKSMQGRKTTFPKRVDMADSLSSPATDRAKPSHPFAG